MLSLAASISSFMRRTSVAKVWAVFPTTTEIDAAAFFVRAEHEQEARDVLRETVRRRLFKTKLVDGEARATMLNMVDSYADDKMVIISTAYSALVGVGEGLLDSDLHVVEVTATVRMMITNLDATTDRSPTLLRAVAEETNLAAAYRRHLPLLKEWIAA
jgi:hypothetical protein